MKDIQNEPVRATMTQQKDNSAVKVILIIFAVIFGLPLLFAILVFVFISTNFDKITAWVDSHADDINYINAPSENVSASARKIYNAIDDDTITIYKNDCLNISSVLSDSDDSYSTMRKICNDGKMKVARLKNSETSNLFVSKDNICIEISFSGFYDDFLRYRYSKSDNGCGIDGAREIKIEANKAKRDREEVLKDINSSVDELIEES